SVSDVYHVLTARYDVARASPVVPASAVAAAAQPSNVAPAAPSAPLTTSRVSVDANAAQPVPPNARPSFHSLFSDTQGQPVSRFLRDLGTSNPRVAAALTGQSAPATMPQPASTPGAPLDLFSDRPSDVKTLFGQGS